MAKQSRSSVLPVPSGEALKKLGEDAVLIPQLKVQFGFPSHDKVDALFAFDLAECVAYTACALISSGLDVEYGVTAVVGTWIERARQQLLDQAIAENVSHLIWFDSDMRFPKDAALRLMRHNKPIVGVNASTRSLPPRFTALKKVGEGGYQLRTLESSTGLEEVEGVGFSVLCMDLRLFRDKLSKIERPWFKNEQTKKRQMGQDIYFCQLIRKAGFKVYVDHDLSKEIAHIGTMEFQTLGVEQWEKLHGTDE